MSLSTTEVARNVAEGQVELDDLERDILVGMANAQEGVANALSGMLRAAQALHKIRNEGLFVLAGFPSFDTYCQDRFGKSERTVFRFLEHAKVIANLPVEFGIDSFCQWPVSEAAAREVCDLPADQQVAILQAAGANPTVKAVRQARAAAGVPPKRSRQSSRPIDKKCQRADVSDVRAAVMSTILTASDASDDDWERIGLQPQPWLDFTSEQIMAAAMGWSVDTLKHAARLMGQGMRACHCGDHSRAERLRIEQESIPLGRPIRLAPVDWYSEQELRGMLECDEEYWATTTTALTRAG